MRNDTPSAATRAVARLTMTVALCLAALAFSLSAVASGYVASPEPGWPHFRGPTRNGISAERGLLPTWPEGGPRVVWSATNLGSGYAAPIIVGKRIYIPGDYGDELRISALDDSGKLLWTTKNGASWKSPYPGARSSCTYAKGRLLHMNAQGELGCFDAETGRVFWLINAIETFGSRIPTWGVSESPLVHGDEVIVTPGGSKASMAALDIRTGKTKWVAEALPNESSRPEGPAYAPPVLVEVFGKRQVLGMTARHCFGVDAQSGQLLWRYPMPTQHEVLGSSPVFFELENSSGNTEPFVFATGPDGRAGQCLRLVKDGDGIRAEPTWNASLDTCHGGIIEIGGLLHGSWYRGYNGWGSVDARDGSVLHRTRDLPMGSAVYADGHLYCLSQTGTMALVKPAREKWEFVSTFKFAHARGNDVWTHPVILDGRLYLRDQQTLRCLDIKR